MSTFEKVNWVIDTICEVVRTLSSLAIVYLLLKNIAVLMAFGQLLSDFLQTLQVVTQ